MEFIISDFVTIWQKYTQYELSSVNLLDGGLYDPPELRFARLMGYGLEDADLEHLMVEEAKLWLDSGAIFGPETKQFERFNLATPRSVVEQAMKQLKAAFDARGL